MSARLKIKALVHRMVCHTAHCGIWDVYKQEGLVFYNSPHCCHVDLYPMVIKSRP